MPDKILHKRSLTPGSLPTTSSLDIGELAINVADGKIHVRRSGSAGNDILSLVTANTITTGSITATNFTGSIQGTASWANNSISSSYVLSSSFATVANTVNTLNQSVTISGSLTVTEGITSSLDGTASYALNSSQANSSNFATSSSYAITASYALNTISIDTTAFATTGSNSFVDNQTISGSINVTNGKVIGDTVYSVVSGNPIAINYGISKGDIVNRFSGIKIYNYDYSGGNLAGQVEIWTDSEAQDFSTKRVSIDGFGNTSITGSLAVNGNITGNVIGTSSWANNVISSSFATSASFAPVFPFTGSAVITGSLSLTGHAQSNVTALIIASNTASLNLNSGNFFTLQLVPGTNTFINPINIKAGQSVLVEVSTTGSATVSFPSSIRQPSGAAYTPTTTTGIDILTFAAFNSNTLHLVTVKNLI